MRVIGIRITGNSSDLDRRLAEARASIRAFGRDVEGGQRGSTSRITAAAAVGVLGVVALGRSIGAAFAGGIEMSAQFEAQMRNVNSITGMTDGALSGMSQRVLDLSKTLPQDANTLAAGLYDIASSGFQGAQGLDVLTASARAASAGISTTAVAAQAISGVLNAYGLSAASAKDVSDTLFQTVNLGVITFDQLGQNLGDVVGTASAAGISIDQVGQAIATITKAGIKPSEAFTALNNLMSQLIKPGEALSAVFDQLGYESGAGALKAKGLAGVMADLRRVTGGNITTMSGLFPEIRALKGALALTSDQGKLYAGVIAGWATAHKGAGATAVALAEQMKSASAHWALIANAIKAGTIEIGLKLLPVLTTLMTSMMEMANGAAPNLQSAVAAVTPLFTALWAIGVDVAGVLKTIAAAVAPVVGALAALAGGAIIAGLTGIAGALAAVTGFMADNRDVVLALASVYAVSLIPSLTAVTVLFARAVYERVVIGLAAVVASAITAAGSLQALAASMFSVQAIATGGVFALAAVAVFGITRGFMALQSAAEDAKKEFEGFGTTTDVLDPAKLQAGVDKLSAVAQHAADVGKEYTGALGVAKLGLGEVFGDGQLGQIAADGSAAVDALAVLRERAANAAKNLADLRATTGLTDAALIKLAKHQNIDLSKPPKEMGDELNKARSYVRDLEKQTGLSAKGIADSVGTDVDAMDAFGKAVQAAADKAAAAFKGSTDVLGTYDPVAAAEKVKAATETLTKARQAQADAQASIKNKGKTTLSEQQELARAERAAHDDTGKSADRVTKAKQRLSELQARQAGKGKLTVAQQQQLARAEQAAHDGSRKSTEKLGKAQQRLSDMKARFADKGKRSISDQQQLAHAEQAITDASVKGAAAQGTAAQNLADLKARLADKGKRTAADDKQLSDAAAAVVSAQSELAAAKAASGTAGLQAAYKTTIAQATAFSRDITTATAKGLDYRVVAKLLEQGPKEAGPVLQTILSDHSGKMIKLVNDSEAQLTALNLVVVAQARLTARAVAAPTDQAIKDLPLAMQIQQATLINAGKVTLAQLATKLGTTEAEIKRIATANGINIATGLKPAKVALDGIGDAAYRAFVQMSGMVPPPIIIPVKFSFESAAAVAAAAAVSGSGILGAFAAAGLRIATGANAPKTPASRKRRRADGGVIAGPYLGPKVDNVAVWANPREYMMQVAAHDYYGTAFMDAVNARRLPRYADGGALGSRATTPSWGGGVQVVKVPVHETRTSEYPMHIEHAHFRDVADARAAYDRQRLANLGAH